MLKPFDELLVPDPIWANNVVQDREGWRSETLADVFAEVQELALDETAPSSVREVFDTARNLLIYSWYAHRFLPVAQMQAIAALELALRVRLGVDAGAKHPPTLQPLLARAVDEALVVGDRMRHFARRKRLAADPAMARLSLQSETSHDFLLVLCGSIPKLRNLLAHGDAYLSPFASLTVEFCCDLINQIFERKQGTA
jgi:hypothetical protein